MSTPNRHLPAVIISALVVAALLAVWVIGLRGSVRHAREKSQALEARLAAATAERITGTAEWKRLEEILAAQSNRSIQAEAKYREEKETHDGLRSQIEKMLAETVRLSGVRAKDQKQIADQAQAARETSDLVQSLTSSNRNLTIRLESAQEEKQKAVQAEADLRLQFASLSAGTASLSNAVSAARTTAEETARKLAAAEQRVSALTNEVALLQRAPERTEKPATPDAVAPAPHPAP